MADTHYPRQHLMRNFALLCDALIGCNYCNRWIWGEDAAVALPKKKNGVPIYLCWPSCSAVGAADKAYPARRLL